MKIIEVVEKVKKYHKGSVNGLSIDETKTRDKILYGDASQECTGIVTTCYASSDVIKAAHERGANLVIVHEALFWNHGDHQEWLADNKVFQAKKKLLDDTKIVVWRDHDYIHSGIPLADGSYIDGIFYGLMKVLDWQEYLVGEGFRPMTFSFPQRTVASIAQELIEKTNLNGLRITGDPKTIVGKLKVVSHIIGQADNDMLKMIESEDIDTIITLEITDYTVSEYIRDSAMLGRPRAAINMGHFNTEEPGMEYMIEYLPQIVGDIPVSYVQSGDAYNFIVK